MIIDAHAHIFDRYTGYGPKGESWPVGNGTIRYATGEEMRILPERYDKTAFTAEMLLQCMDDAGVDKAVLLQAGLYGFHNQYVFESARRYPERFIPTFTLDPYAHHAIEILQNIEKMRGRIFKFELSTGAGLTGYHPYFTVDAPVMELIYQYAERHHGTIAFDLGTPDMPSYQIDAMRRIVSRYSGVRFVLCHLLAPNGSRTDKWLEELRKLAQQNVWFDISALPWNIREAYPFPSSLEHIIAAKNIVGADRLIWGSDVPLLLTAMTYRQTYEYIFQSSQLTAAENEKIITRNALDAFWE